MLLLVRLNHETIPDDFRRFPLAHLVESKFVNIVLDVPFRGVEAAPINHAQIVTHTKGDT